MPFHMDGNHWILLVTAVGKKRLLIYDSLRRNESDYHPVIDAVCSYLNLCEVQSAGRDWAQVIRDAPQQIDGYSCGLFACLAARHVVHGMPLLQQREAQNLDRVATRRVMALELIRGELVR
jgi:Ulp1 family protease